MISNDIKTSQQVICENICDALFDRNEMGAAVGDTMHEAIKVAHLLPYLIQLSDRDTIVYRFVADENAASRGLGDAVVLYLDWVGSR